MDSIPSSSSLHSQQLLPSRFSPPLPFTSFRPFPNQKPRNLTSRASITFPAKQRNETVLAVTRQNQEERTTISECLTKELVRSLFCFAVGVSAFGAFRIAPALAIPTMPWVVFSDKKKVKRNTHEYSDCTKRVLETVPGLLRSIEEARKGDADMEAVRRALDVVRLEKEKSEREILERMHPQLMDLKKELQKLELREVEISGKIEAVKREYDRLTGSELVVGKVVNEVEKKMLEQSMVELVKNYNEISEKIGEVEGVISRKETVALSYGVLEVLFIERECEQLVERFKQEVKQKEFESSLASSVNGLSKPVVQKDLETVQRKHLEQTILPSIVDVDDLGPFFHQDSVDFAQRLKRSLEDSKEQQKNLVTQISKNMKYDKEKRSIVYSSEEEEMILLDRDRVISRTWYNEEKNRWEMDPLAVPYAVTKKLIEHVRIRADWGTMYIALKGEDEEFYVDIKEFEILFKDIGGFEGLYRKMIACDIPTAVHLMWIPLSELKLRQQFSVILRFPRRFLTDQWNSEAALNARSWFFDTIKDTTDDLMTVIGFPVMELLVLLLNRVRVKLGMACPEEGTMDTTGFLKWQVKAETRTNARRTQSEIQWIVLFITRTAISGFVLFHVFKFMRRKIPRLLGYGPVSVRNNPNRRKLGRVAYYFQKRWRSVKSRRRDGVDPIKTAFEHMKRVKKPPIPLKSFSSIESMEEEISEVVTFLRNPRAFQEMGARAPRGVLIVGERGTGKTSLALAIAAEAKVPVVKIKARQLEAGMWVGQSASNVRELFQTARDLAPVILFIEDFDLFAGVRGKFIHTENQDHEAFINQLLVELDGFEKQDGVVLMATTRNLKQIDEALKRPGRMDRIFHLQRPTQAERENILYSAAKETMDDQLIDYVDWKKVAEKTSLLRPTELKLVPVALEGSAFRSKVLDTDELMSYCSFFATFSSVMPQWLRKTKIVKKVNKMLVNHLGLTLAKEDLQNVVDLMEPYGQISNGIELLSPPHDWTRETKFPHAVWAAGRGLIAHLLPNFDVVDNLWLEPQSWQGIGCTKITKAQNGGYINGSIESRSYLEKKLVFCFGSYVASQMLFPFGEENLLSSSEIQQAQEIATRMVIQYGWGPDDSPAIYYCNNAVSTLSMAGDYEYVMAAKVEKIFDLAYLKAREMLQRNRRVLEKTVEELLEFEILTGKGLERITKDNGGIKEKEPFTLFEVQASEPTSGSLLERGNASGGALLAS
ncbi:probable inactive ATP-dependent zinc metalloprotease FTSHI 5, chloroplastic [Lathyrus oleraceus]|uniref:Inactive ATP-dependent zinc metalloprotease FTSHI 5 n=1 Tax=Pisum sativum TaxID=3888 RepID=A0A9D4WB26_PEA|nr:probable inactive ATP-dependent zinc metalloprotease FTSHI 5, chloroplastic [Pisum sativum]KAI5398282.1 inactive ATP-dependent zinc metalloprotease FTSHI 5 [Pisum sativum]